MSKGKSKINGKKGSEKTYTKLDQIWGENTLSRYRASSAQEYEDQVSQMSKIELWEHAVKMGESPVDKKDLLIKKLVRRYNQEMSKNRLSDAHSKASSNRSKKYDEQALKILKEGK